jgi:hypothetical protein
MTNQNFRERSQALTDILKTKGLEAGVQYAREQGVGPIAHAFLDSVSGLVDLDTSGLSRRLNESKDEISREDFGVILKTCLHGLDSIWERKYGWGYSKGVLPQVLLYDIASRNIDPEIKPIVDDLWKNYNLMNYGDFSLYADREKFLTNVQNSGQAADGSIPDGLMMLKLRSDSSLRSGNFIYNGRRISSKADAESTIDSELNRWLNRLNSLDPKTRRKAIVSLDKILQSAVDTSKRLSNDRDFAGAYGDWLQTAYIFEKCQADLRSRIR